MAKILVKEWDFLYISDMMTYYLRGEDAAGERCRWASYPMRTVVHRDTGEGDG